MQYLNFYERKLPILCLTTNGAKFSESVVTWAVTQVVVRGHTEEKGAAPTSRKVLKHRTATQTSL